MNVLPTHKWDILRYVGCALPQLTAIQKRILREQLDQRYCPVCGEYMYNPYRLRSIRHYHHLIRKHRFIPLFQKRILIHVHNQLVEWTRRFPQVMRLLISEKNLAFSPPQFVHRIPAVRMWTIDEWNLLYPILPIWKDGCSKRLNGPHPVDCLYTPNLLVV